MNLYLSVKNIKSCQNEATNVCIKMKEEFEEFLHSFYTINVDRSELFEKKLIEIYDNLSGEFTLK